MPPPITEWFIFEDNKEENIITYLANSPYQFRKQEGSNIYTNTQSFINNVGDISISISDGNVNQDTAGQIRVKFSFKIEEDRNFLACVVENLNPLKRSFILSSEH